MTNTVTPQPGAYNATDKSVRDTDRVTRSTVARSEASVTRSGKGRTNG